MELNSVVTLFIAAVVLVILVTGIVAVARGAKFKSGGYRLGSVADSDGWYRAGGEGFIK